MFVLMVRIRKVSVTMGQGLVAVNVSMGLSLVHISWWHIAMPVRMIVMLIMVVFVSMSGHFMHMEVTVALAKV